MKKTPRVKLYEMEHSPFCIPIAQALRSLGVRFRSLKAPSWDRGQIIRLTKGAYYQVPLLQDGQRVIYESSPASQDIARHVDRKFGRGQLFPRRHEGMQTILIRYLEDEVEMTTFKLVDPKWIRSIPDLAARVHVIRHKERKFGQGCVDEWTRRRNELRRQADILLEPFEKILRHSSFLLDAKPVFADFLLYGILGNFTYRNYNALASNQRGLKEWQGRMRRFSFPHP